ncbi:MmgE/PrpD family protein [Rhizobium terrae]|uniref:MmgE/PrpD family protein n=1 Tax=Rhizobium terrae TaxID=2171756 RepID=UPI000E3D5148|nr:MmgE/PrpD family protein [Rhizobium terrae]
MSISGGGRAVPLGSAQYLANYIVSEGYDRLPAEVVEKAKLCLLDSLGCLIGAYRLPASKIIAAFVNDLGGADEVHVAGSHLKTSCATAAFANATLINALDFDDIYKKGHLGATVISTALAVGEKVQCSGREMLEAIVVGYEISGRVGISMSHSKPRKLLHGHGTWQTLGATATASKLLKLDADQSAHALAIAAANAPVASVMKTVYGANVSMAKNNFGTAAQVGVNAATLAYHGFTGPLDIFDGDTGFWRMFGADAVDRDILVGGLGEVYEILDVGFKPYSCCRILQSSIEATLAVFEKSGVTPESGDYEKIVISAPPIVCEWPFDNRTPSNIWEAQFSGPYCLAMAMLGREPGPDWFLKENFCDPKVAELISRIELRPNDTNRSTFHHASSVELHLLDGELFAATVAVAKGNAANPLSREFVAAKFYSLAALLLPEARHALIDAVYQLEHSRAVIDLIRELTL